MMRHETSQKSRFYQRVHIEKTLVQMWRFVNVNKYRFLRVNMIYMVCEGKKFGLLISNTYIGSGTDARTAFYPRFGSHPWQGMVTSVPVICYGIMTGHVTTFKPPDWPRAPSYDRI